MTYAEFAKHMESMKECRMTMYKAVCYLVGYKGSVDANDLENIRRAYMDMIIDK